MEGTEDKNETGNGEIYRKQPNENHNEIHSIMEVNLNVQTKKDVDYYILRNQHFLS